MCTIELTTEVTLGSPGHQVLGIGATSLARDQGGRYFSIAADRAHVIVFDSAGQYLATLGEGVDLLRQLRGISSLRFGAGDTLYVFHSQLLVDLFSPTLAVVRRITLPVPAGPSPYVLRSGRIVVGALVPTAEQIGLPYHIVDEVAGIVQSIGDVHATITPDRPAPAPQPFLVSADEKVIWTVTDYRIEHRSLLGEQQSIIQVFGVPWAQLLDSSAASGLKDTSGHKYLTPSRTEFAGADKLGLLWINGRRVARESNAGIRVEQSMQMSDGETYVIDVFDPKARRVVASYPVPAPIRFFPNSDLAFLSRRDSNGIRNYVVSHVKLRGR